MANQEVLPASITSPPLLNDPSVLSSWSNRLWVAIGCTTVLISLAKSMVAAAHSHIWLGPMLAGCVGYILADLFSGANILSNDPIIHGLVSVWFGCLMFSQQFHAWAHCPKSKLPPLVVALQDAGVLLSRSQHAAHHRPPYNNNYCIVSGIWNKFMDDNKVFEALERFFFFQFGVQPQSWNESGF
ncbi:hypothetical protein QYF36_026204 [Acer negundo]|nr:hypothetical protein QYF36_026204 [Acer negundo]